MNPTVNKALAFLEKHVQWIALALGGAILLFAVYRYWLAPDLAAEVPGRGQYGPAAVDAAVLQGPGEQLSQALRNARVEAPPVPNLSGDFLKNLRVEGPVPSLALGPVPPPAFEFEQPSQRMDVNLQVATLATVPPAKVTHVGTFRVEVDLPADPADPAAETGPADLSAVQVRYRVPVEELADAIRKTELPPRFGSTSVLDATLQRERRGNDGNFSELTSVAKLRNVTLPPTPGANADMEAKRAFVEQVEPRQADVLQPEFYPTLGGEDPYLPPEQVAAEGEEIAPAADPAAPAGPGEPVNGVHPGFNPADPATWPPTNQLTPTERRMIRDHREKEKSRGGQGDPGDGYGGGYGGYGGEFNYGQNPDQPGSPGQSGDAPVPGVSGALNASGDVALLRQQGRPGQQRPGRPGQQQPGQPGQPFNPGDPYGGDPYGGYGGEFGDPYGGYGGYGDYGGIPGQPGPGGQPAVPGRPEVAPAPTGAFNPADLAGQPIEGWAWDATAVPGETYRYRVVYSIKNPLFATQNIGANPELAERLVLTSEAGEQDWGPAITAQPMSYYFVTGMAADGRLIYVTVYRFAQGRWQSAAFKVSPGDPIGGLDKGVDYDTGSTLVDVRKEGGGSAQFALIVDPEGRFQRRTSDDSRTDPKFGELQKLVSTAIAAAAGAVTPGP